MQLAIAREKSHLMYMNLRFISNRQSNATHKIRSNARRMHWSFGSLAPPGIISQIEEQETGRREYKYLLRNKVLSSCCNYGRDDTLLTSVTRTFEIHFLGNIATTLHMTQPLRHENSAGQIFIVEALDGCTNCIIVQVTDFVRGNNIAMIKSCLFSSGSRA